MLKDTFSNLREEKKRAIDATVQEFYTRHFSEASINRIGKNAGILNGGFYSKHAYFAYAVVK